MPIRPENLIINANPTLYLELSDELNKKDGIAIANLSIGSIKKVWWICKTYNHQWKATPNNRTKGRGCPICSGSKVLEGFNDLRFRFPEIADEWNFKKNNMLPQEVTFGSTCIVWWSCKSFGHEWQDPIHYRVRERIGCKVCSGKKLLKGFNDLKTMNFSLSQEWHPIKNSLGADEVLYKSSQKVWWRCKIDGYEWQATVRNRNSGTGCPTCSGQKVLRGMNDLSTLRPDIAEEWHPTKNKFSPDSVTLYSDFRVWWKGQCGHEWETAINNRTKGKGCPICSSRIVIKGVNDLATLRPDVALEWHPDKNKDKPHIFAVSSSHTAWWKCILHGHEWKNTINSRTSRNTKCPICTNRKVLKGFNDLSSLKPKISAEWHPTKNKNSPEAVTISSNQKIWWKCKFGHEWETTVNSRTAGNGCKRCSIGKTEKAFTLSLSNLSGFNFSPTILENINRRMRKGNRVQVDSICKELKIAVEYDGEWVHGPNNPEKKSYEQKLAEDADTTEALLNNGYKVIRIREAPLDHLILNINNLHSPNLLDNLFQISFKNWKYSMSARDNVEEIAKEIIAKKSDWFRIKHK